MAHPRGRSGCRAQCAFVIDPVCLFHGKRKSEHECIVCCICYRTLTFEECHVMPDGEREDVCNECAAKEAAVLAVKEANDGLGS